MEHQRDVLIIETEPAIRDEIRNLCRELGCRVQVASEDALWDLAPAAAGFDLAIIEWERWQAKQPIEGAATVLPARPPVVVVTQLNEDADWTKALEAGAFDIVEPPDHPFARKEFQRVVALALNRSALPA